MSFGGGHPYPRKLGGGESRVQTLLAAISADRGDAYSTDPNSVVYAENMMLARAINGAWGTNERLGNLWNPYSCSPDVLKRWETILALATTAKDTLVSRRKRVAAKMAFNASGLRGDILLEMQALGSLFYDVEYIDIANAQVFSPDASYPFGTQNADSPWSSTVAKVVIRLQKPTGYTEADFLRGVSQTLSLIDPYLPAWVTIDWYRAGPVSSASGGLSGAGFYADDDFNTDYEVLDG